MKLTTKNIALIAIFAALYYAASLISPFIPAVGIPEITIKLEALLASIFGLLMGPYLGFLTALLGAFVTWVLPPSGGISYGLPFLLSPPLNALVVGFIFYKKWKYAFVVLASLIAVFWLLPPSQPLSEFWYVSLLTTWDKIIALALIFPVVKLAKFKSMKLQPLFYFLLAFIGNQADNMWGADIFAVPVVYEGIFGINSVETVRLLFTVSPLIYPAIRIIQALIAMVIAVPLIKALESNAIVPLKESIAA
jgi:uncharacterized membrane protein